MLSLNLQIVFGDFDGLLHFCLRMAIVPHKVFWVAFPLAGAVIGKWLDRMETERMSRFRDKSSLFHRQLKPGEQPSWP